LLSVFLKIETTNETDVPQIAATDEVQANGAVRLASLAGWTLYRSMYRVGESFVCLASAKATQC